jgi:hypothetical protein
VQQGALAIELAQNIWPDAAVSFYGCPWGTGEPTPQWEDEMAAALAPILDRVDWLAPSIYDKYRDEDAPPASVERQRRLHESGLHLAARVAAGRPILPWVRHRYYEVGAPYHNNLIRKYEFLDQLQWAWDFEVHRAPITGFVLWYRDRDMWEEIGTAPPEASGEVVEDVLDDIEYKYYNWMQQVTTNP